MTRSSLSRNHRERRRAGVQPRRVMIRHLAQPATRLFARPATHATARLAAVLFLLAGLGTAVAVFASSGDETRTGAIAGTVRDTAGGPLAGASVLVATTPLAALSGVDGSFRIDGLSAGSYTIEVRLAGYRPGRVTDLRVKPGATVQTEVRLEPEDAGAISPATDQSAEPRAFTESAKARAETETKRGIGATLDALRSLAAPYASPPRPSSAAEKGSGHMELHEGFMPPSPALDWAPRLAPPPPVVPATGGSRPPNDEAFDSMFFRHYGVNPFVPADEDSLSTFALDVDAASYTLTRRYLDLGRLPDPAAVRVEEFVNYLPQGYPEFEDEDFRIFLDGAPSPFGPGYQLVRVGLKARTVSERARPPLNLTFVIDGSGSMAREDRLGLVQASLRMLVDELRDGDRVGIVMFQTDARAILEPIILGSHARAECRDGDHHRGWSPFDRHDDDRCEHGWSPSGRQQVLEAIDRLVAGGSTNAEGGLLLGYDMARRSFRSAASNRVILCSDGVANEGRTGAESILARVRDEADKGIRLTAVGCGMGNYNDVLLEQLADRGDGNYFYVDDLSEARRVLVDGLTGTLLTVAEDAKVQVAFDPARVLRYRLLGFENRDVADRDFRNDRVDAGEVGPGHEVTALYEVKLAPAAREGRLATVRVRYARPREEAGGRRDVREIAAVLDSRQLCRRFESASPLFRLDAAAAEFAEILRGSYWAKESRPADVTPVARRAAEDLRRASWGGVDPRAADAAAELVSMLEQAGRLQGQLSRNEEE